MHTEKHTTTSADHLKSNRTRRSATVGALAVALLTGVSAHAAVLTQVDHWTLYSENFSSPEPNNFKVSVVAGNDSFGGPHRSGGLLNQPYNDVIDSYRFFNQASAGVVGTYAQGGADIIGVPTPTGGASTGGSNNFLQLWETTDPGVDFANSPADYTSGTMVQSYNLSGSIDVSGRKSGALYFFYGAYRNTPSFDLTMTGSGQPDVTLLDAGEDDFANNNEMYGMAVIFETGLAYDTINYNFSIGEANNGRGRFGGIVLTGSAFYAPEPSTSALAFLGLAAISAFRKKRMSVS